VRLAFPQAATNWLVKFSFTNLSKSQHSLSCPVLLEFQRRVTYTQQARVPVLWVRFTLWQHRTQVCSVGLSAAEPGGRKLGACEQQPSFPAPQE
jgi:hypothetical protein